MLFAFMHSNFLRLVRINVLAWGEEGGELGYCQISVPVPLTHTISPSCLPRRCSWSMTHLCIIIWNSWEKEMYQFKGNPCLPKKIKNKKIIKTKIPKQNITRNPFFALLLLSSVQPFHFQLEKSFSLSRASWTGAGELLQNRCVCRGTRYGLVCRCVWPRAGLCAWVCVTACLHISQSPSALTGGCCMSAPCRVGIRCSPSCCWKYFCLCLTNVCVCA